MVFGRRAAPALLFAFLLAAPPADARWSSPETVAGPVDSGWLESPAVALGPGGRGVVTWTQREGIGVATSASWRQPFGRVALVPGSAGQYASTVGVDAAGNATIAWVYVVYQDPENFAPQEGVRVAVRRRRGGFTRPWTVSSPRYDTYFPRLAVAPSGNTALWWASLGGGSGARVSTGGARFGAVELPERAIATWTFQRGARATVSYTQRKGLFGVIRTHDGKLSRPRLLARRPPGESFLVDAAADGYGPRAALWHQRRADSNALVLEVRTNGRELGQPRRLIRGDGGDWFFPSDLAAGSAGRAAVAWLGRRLRSREIDYYDDRAYPGALRAAVARPHRPFGRPQLLAPRSPERPRFGVAVAAGGPTAVVVWRGVRPNSAQGIYAARAGARGRFGRPVLISRADDGPLSNPEVAVDDQGRALVAWLDGLDVRVARRSIRKPDANEPGSITTRARIRP
jgi:hypothetical protein